MKKLSNITSVQTRDEFKERTIEKFVKDNLPPSHPKDSKLSGMPGFTSRYREIECCAAELPVYGTVEIIISQKNPPAMRRITHRVSTRFIVFCTREEDKNYKVAWTCSLS